MTLTLTRIGLRAGARTLLAEFSLTVRPGETVTLMGPSGVGKSSLIAYIAGILPDGVTGSGAVSVGGLDVAGVPPHRRRVGVLFQDDVLFPHMSVGDNLLFGLHPDVRGRTARRDAVAQALADMELPAMAGRNPATLSGGQRARVALARVLLSRPAVLLLDEPFTGLEASLRARLRILLLAQVEAHGLPCLWATHDPADIAGTTLQFPSAPGD